jgi:C4-dicarboxylate transporter
VIPAAEKADLPASSLTALFTALTAGTSAAFEKVPGITENIIAAAGSAMKIADYQAFKTVYLASIAFSGLSICAALCAQNVDDKLTDQVARRFRSTEKVEDSVAELNVDAGSV